MANIRKAEKELRTCREKYWSELTEAEKVERMRSEVKRMSYAVMRLNRAVDNLLNHTHVGEMVYMPLRERYGDVEAESPSIRNKDEVYF